MDHKLTLDLLEATGRIKKQLEAGCITMQEAHNKTMDLCAEYLVELLTK